MQTTYSQLMRFYHRFGKFYTKQFTPLLAETGLSMREMHVLLFLANNPGLDTARNVTLYRGISKSQVSEAVELLAEREILRRVPDASDRRVVHLRVTEAGEPLVDRAREIQTACWQRMMAGLTAEENEQLHVILKKVFANGEQAAKGESLK